MSRFKNFWAAYRPEIVLIPLVFALDRISKALALDLLKPAESIKIAPFFRLTYVENTGAAFGSFQGGNRLLACASVIILALLFKWRGECSKGGAPARYGIIFIIGGALGNLYDRIVLGFVIDYFDFIIWPVFNAADSFICAGAALLGFTVLKSGLKKDKEG
jgi:signal peptidase II